MKQATLTTTATNQIVTTYTNQKVEFTAAFTAQIAKLQVKKSLSLADMLTIGKYTIVALGKNMFALRYNNKGIAATAAVITVKGNKIVAVS